MSTTTKEYWGAEAKKRVLHSAEGELFEGYWTKRYLKNLKYLKEGERILDIGCGDAKYFIKLTGRFKEFYGVELSNVHFESAKNVFPAGNYIVADGGKLPFRDSSFDTIISFGAFEHNENIDLIFKECYRGLDKNGVLLFSVPNYVSLWFPYLYMYHCVIKKHNRISAIGHHYSRKQLKTKLQRAGFKNVKIVDSIYAAPIPIVGLGVGLLKKAGSVIYRESRLEQKVMETTAGEKHGKMKENLSRWSYRFDKLFYPLERLGFGFMRVIYCEK
jgi:SAM-dependent methyltransferase